MKRFITLAICLAALALPARALAEVRIITTTPGLAALAREVAGADADVESLAGAEEDPHFVDGKPSFMVKLHRADLLVLTGASLEAGWLPPLLLGARNPDIQDGKPGYLDASRHVGKLLDVPTRLDRALGDVHPEGNPHFLYDPRRGLRIAQAIAERLNALDPEHADSYQRRYAAFEKQLTGQIKQWEERMSAHRGQAIVGYHKSLTYLNDWLGLEALGFVEPLPGISPSASHLSKLILQMKSAGAPALVTEPWHINKAARIVAEKSGARLVTVPGDVGSANTSTYSEFIDAVVSALAEAYGASGRN